MSNTAEYFDTLSGEWSERYQHDRRFRRRYEKIVGMFDLLNLRGGRAIDLGCGSGIFTKALLDRNYITTGVDLSPEMIAASTAACKKEVDAGRAAFIVSSLDALPEHLDTFDLAISLSALEYVKDDTTVLQWLALHVAQGGIAIVSVPNKRGWLRRIERWIVAVKKQSAGKMFANRGEYVQFQLHQYSPEELDRKMMSLGFEKVESDYLNAGFDASSAVLSFFEKKWWAALYLAAYQKK